MRLTNYHREKIRDALMEHAFTEREKAMTKQYGALADQIWAELVGPHQRAMAKMPAWFFQRGTHIAHDVNRHIHRDGFSNHYPPQLEMTRERLLPKDQQLPVNEHKELRAKLDRLDQQWASLAEDKVIRKAQIEAALGPFTTVEALTEGWPAAMGVLPKGMFSANVPMVANMGELNVALGLVAQARAN